VEHKFRVTKGAEMEYSWHADTGSLFFDLHGEPAGGKAGYFESFEKGTMEKADGTITAPFTGTIGWYWKNNGSDNVVVTVKARGHDTTEQ